MSETVNAATAAPGNAPSVEQNGAETSPSESNVNTELSGSQDQIDAIQDAVDSGEISQAEANKMVKKLQLKVNGKVKEVEVDLSDDDFLKNQFQLAESAKIAMQQRAEQEKLFRQLIESGKGDPLKFIQELYGIDADELAAAHIERKIEHMKKSPEVLERERIQAELEAAREEAKKLKEEKDLAELSKIQQETLTGLKTEISEAIKAHTKLPDTKYVQQKMAQALMWAEDNGFEGATAADVAPLVEAEMRKEMNELYDMMPEELIEAMIGRKNIDRLRKKKIAKAKDIPSVSTIKPTASNKVEVKQTEQERIDAKKFWRGR